MGLVASRESPNERRSPPCLGFMRQSTAEAQVRDGTAATVGGFSESRKTGSSRNIEKKNLALFLVLVDTFFH